MEKRKRGRPRKHEKPEPAFCMIYECLDRRGQVHVFPQSSELTAEEAMKRLGVLKRPFQVTRWPKDKPEEGRIVQFFESA